MMPTNAAPKSPLTEAEIANMRQNLNLLLSQIKVGRLDVNFLTQQIEKLARLLENVEADRKESSKFGRYEALYNVSKTLGTSLDLQTVLDQVMDAIIKLTGAERAFLMLQDDDGGLNIRAARNFDQQTLDSDNARYSRTVANQVLDSGTPILTTNAAEDPRFMGQASIIGQALRSIMATPLRARGVVIGVAYVDSRVLAGLFRNEDLDALDALTSQAAIAIDNARLFNATDQALDQRVEELRQLRRIDLLLNQTLDVDRIHSYIVEWTCRLVEAETSHLLLVEGQPPVITAEVSYTAQTETIDAHPAADLNGLRTQALQSISASQSISAHDSDGQPVLIVPICRESGNIGAVILRHSAHHAFSSDDQDLIERIVTRAAIALENASLYAAVRQADQAKSEFVGIVAHDLKAPMNSIAGYSELMLMQDEALTTKQKDYLRKVKDTVRRMEMLVSDLADISRIEGGHFFMEESRVLVEDVIQALRDSTMPQIAEREHQWVEHVEPGLPMLHIDYYRLLQVLTNLVSNAYKYTPNGGSITLAITRSGDRVRFSVSDTGIGLTPEGIAMLGTKFWRAEDRYTRSQPGTGLGFAITRSLVEQMGSQLEITSVPMQGSTFAFDIQIADSN